MVLPFALLALGALAIIAGFTGRTLGEVLRGTIGRGFALADIDVPAFADIAKPAAADLGGLQDIPGIQSGSEVGGRPSKTSAIAAVEWAAKVGKAHGLDVISSHRPGDYTSSGSLSNHAGNDASRAARDLSNTGNAKGSPEQEAAVREILQGFGRAYPRTGEIIDSFQWGELSMEIIYRTPKYGGHIGHIHVGGHR